MNDHQASALSETARVHVQGIEALIAENDKLRETIRQKELTIATYVARDRLQTEALVLTQAQCQFYQNFGVTLAGKLDAIMAVCADAVEASRRIAGAPAIAAHSPADEARLAELTHKLSEKPSGETTATTE